MVPLELQRRAVREERRFEARVTPQGRRESSRGEPRAGMSAETGSSEPARLGSALVQPGRGGPGGRWAAGRSRWIGAGGGASRETGCAGTGCGRTAGRVRSADGAEHDCSRGVPRTWPPGSASRASRVGAASVSGSPPDRVHRTSARSGQGASGGRASPRERSASVRAGRCRGTAGARGERDRLGPSERGAVPRGESTGSAPRCHRSRAGQ